VRGFFYVVQ